MSDLHVGDLVVYPHPSEHTHRVGRVVERKPVDMYVIQLEFNTVTPGTAPTDLVHRDQLQRRSSYASEHQWGQQAQYALRDIENVLQTGYNKLSRVKQLVAREAKVEEITRDFPGDDLDAKLLYLQGLIAGLAAKGLRSSP